MQSIFDPFKEPEVVGIYVVDTFEYLEMDATVSESHQYQTELTKHEVETGFDITDNIRTVPIVLNLSCVITNSPGFLGSNKILNSIKEKPSQNAFDFITDIRDKKYLCTVDTSFKPYDNMIMTDFNPRKSLDESGGLFFDLVFEEVRFATAKEGEVDDLAPDDTASTTATKVQNKGVQKEKVATKAKKTSVLKGITNELGRRSLQQ